MALLAGLVTSLAFVPGAQASDHPISAKSLKLKRAVTDRELLIFKSTDPAVPFPIPGGPDDPSLVGMTIDLFTFTGPSSATLVAPALNDASMWRVRTGPPGSYRFKYADAPDDFSGIRSISFKAGKSIKIVARAVGIEMSQPSAAIGIRITTGDLRTCALFDPTTIQFDEVDRFSARNASSAVISNCFDSTLSGVPGSTSTLPPTSTSTLAPTTTTTLAPTTTTTLAPTTTTTTLFATTTTTLPGPLPDVCDVYSLTWGAPGTAAGQFSGPRGLSVGTLGVHVVDSRNDRVQVFDESGTFLARWGSYGQGAGEFDRPREVATGPTGSVFVTDRTNHRVQRFAAAGSFELEFGSFGVGAGQLNQPQGVAVDAVGNVYVSDKQNHRIQKYTSDGVFIASIGSGFGVADGQLNQPYGLASDGDNLYVADSGNNRIQVFTLAGDFVRAWGTNGSLPGEFQSPRGIAADRGLLYVADSGNHRIQIFDQTGTFLGEFGTFGVGAGEFNEPRGVAIGRRGRVFVADTENSRVQKFVCP